jgi:hypothetical protein
MYLSTNLYQQNKVDYTEISMKGFKYIMDTVFISSPQFYESIPSQVKVKKGKDIPVTGHGGP